MAKEVRSAYYAKVAKARGEPAARVLMAEVSAAWASQSASRSPGQPVGKGRPRAFRMGKGVRMFTPEKTVSYENLVATAAHGAMRGKPPVEGAVAVDLDIRLMVPMSWSAKKRAQALEGQIHPTKKPDADNVTKAIFDAMNGIVWGDDVQVVRLSLCKRYDATPGVTVTAREVA